LARVGPVRRRRGNRYLLPGGAAAVVAALLLLARATLLFPISISQHAHGAPWQTRHGHQAGQTIPGRLAPQSASARAPAPGSRIGFWVASRQPNPDVGS